MKSGRRIVLTRAAGNGEWAERLETAGHAVLVLPLIRHESISPAEEPDFTVYDWILFTSPQGVRSFYSRYGGRLKRYGSPHIACLGGGTCAALRQRGFADDLQLDCKDGAEFAREFIARVPASARVLLPGPERRMAEPEASLRRAGFALRLLPLFRTESIPADELPSDPFTPDDLLFFASPSAVRAFADAWPDLRLDCATIGETSAAAARQFGLAPRVADRPGLDGLCAAAGIALPDAENGEENDLGRTDV